MGMSLQPVVVVEVTDRDRQRAKTVVTGFLILLVLGVAGWVAVVNWPLAVFVAAVWALVAVGRRVIERCCKV